MLLQVSFGGDHGFIKICTPSNISPYRKPCLHFPYEILQELYMKDQTKTIKHLIEELEALREQVAELKKEHSVHSSVIPNAGEGICVCHNITERINVVSEPGRGTTFQILFPLIRSKIEEIEAGDSSQVKGGTETILIGEDNVQVRNILKEVLSNAGYSVIEAVDGDDAVGVFHKNKDRIHLLILDVIMPKKNGKEVYVEIKKVKSDIKVIFVSGYSADVIHKKGILEVGLNFISKPVSPADLLLKVREVLDK
jgi:CheY-like chemotaxis protein